jgi:alkylation response protein AidB-like acyl-CoA dehydrogenase
MFKTPFHDILFISRRVHSLEHHYKKLKIDVPIQNILEETGKFAENVLWPINQLADKKGCKFEQGHVMTPPGFKNAYKTYQQGGWQGISLPEKYGGAGLPLSIHIIKSEILATSNWSWSMYPGLGYGAAQTLLKHGNEDVKNRFLPQLCSGEWLGTMCLTEPQCGSDLSLVKTMATPLQDNSYNVTGTKIFISCGNHDLTENILHCVLARTPNSPPGTKGISLFAVPKSRNVVCTRIENKMGCHGSSTCELQFNNAQGWLIGDLNKGLNHMFTFINTSRIGTALQGLSACELSFQLSLDYAKNRLAMRSLSGIKNPNGDADPIIVHPDIRRMLLTQRVFAMSARSMIYECALLADKNDEKSLSFLTPILKGFLTERGIEAANLAIQIYGGHGYISDNPVEQILRDTRISSLYEGTTGIQALDLLGRKILPNKLRDVRMYTKKVVRFCILNYSNPNSQILLKSVLSWNWYSHKIAHKVYKTKDYDIIGTVSVDYLMYSGYIMMGFHWLKMSEITNDTDTRFEADFYFKYIFPRIKSHIIPIESETLMHNFDYTKLQ